MYKRNAGTSETERKGNVGYVLRFIIEEMLRKYIEQFSDRKLRIDWRVANAQFQLNDVAEALYHQ